MGDVLGMGVGGLCLLVFHGCRRFLKRGFV